MSIECGLILKSDLAIRNWRWVWIDSIEMNVVAIHCSSK